MPVCLHLHFHVWSQLRPVQNKDEHPKETAPKPTLDCRASTNACSTCGKRNSQVMTELNTILPGDLMTAVHVKDAERCVVAANGSAAAHLQSRWQMPKKRNEVDTAHLMIDMKGETMK